ncbi:MAG: molybdate ABC transporter substrate-binding protein [Xanthobacteraceae bacterium]
MIGIIGRIAALATLLTAQAAFADPALNVYSTIAMRGALEELVPQFQKESGQTLAITWGTAAILTKRIEAGDPADVAILTRANLESLGREGKIAPGTEIALAQSGIAVAIKSGAHKPDISTPDAFKQALLEAKSVAYSDPAAGGASGVHFAKVLEDMGIGDEIKPKTKHPPAGGNAATLVATGEAELAIQQKPEIMNAAGVDVVGPLPGALNKITAFGAAVTSNSKNTDAAKALLKFLQSPAADKVLKASGFDPD